MAYVGLEKYRFTKAPIFKRKFELFIIVLWYGFNVTELQKICTTGLHIAWSK